MHHLKSIRPRLRHLLLAGLLAGLLPVLGCATAPPPPPSAQLTIDARPAQPHPHARWVKGHYVYRHGRYVWMPGHWRR